MIIILNLVYLCNFVQNKQKKPKKKHIFFGYNRRNVEKNGKQSDIRKELEQKKTQATHTDVNLKIFYFWKKKNWQTFQWKKKLWMNEFSVSVCVCVFPFFVSFLVF